MEVRWIHTRSHYRCACTAIETSQVHPCMVKFTSTQSWLETLLCLRLRFDSWEHNEMTIWCQNTYTVTQIEDEDWSNNTVGYNKKFSVPMRGRIIFGSLLKSLFGDSSQCRAISDILREGSFACSRARVFYVPRSPIFASSVANHRFPSNFPSSGEI